MFNIVSGAAYRGVRRRLAAWSLHPPFFFVLAKKNAPCTVEEKAAWSKLARAGKFGDATADSQLSASLPSSIRVRCNAPRHPRLCRKLCRGISFQGVCQSVQLLFPLPLRWGSFQRGGCSPLFGNSPSGAAAGREAERFDKHPGMRCHGTACGISVGGEARYSAPGWNWASLRKAGYQPSHPQTCPHGQVWTKRLFLPPCTAHSFSPRRKRMGGANSTPQVCGARPCKRHRLRY